MTRSRPVYLIITCKSVQYNRVAIGYFITDELIEAAETTGAKFPQSSQTETKVFGELCGSHEVQPLSHMVQSEVRRNKIYSDFLFFGLSQTISMSYESWIGIKR